MKLIFTEQLQICMRQLPLPLYQRTLLEKQKPGIPQRKGIATYCPAMMCGRKLAFTCESKIVSMQMRRALR
jgi:hypothetical protein